MAMADNGNLYIGAVNCANVGAGCLTTFPTSSQTATISSTLGDVSAIVPISGRGLVYVTQDGELVIYETSTNKPRANNQLDIVGQATAMVEVK
jgi:hypothetical protein